MPAGNVRCRHRSPGGTAPSTDLRPVEPPLAGHPWPTGLLTTTQEMDGEGRKVKHRRRQRPRRTCDATRAGWCSWPPTPRTRRPATSTISTATSRRSTMPAVISPAPPRMPRTASCSPPRRRDSPEERVTGVVEYDKVGNPLQVRDGNGNIRITTYNGLNLPWQQYDPAPFDGQLRRDQLRQKRQADRGEKPQRQRHHHRITTCWAGSHQRHRPGALQRPDRRHQLRRGRQRQDRPRQARHP